MSYHEAINEGRIKKCMQVERMLSEVFDLVVWNNAGGGNHTSALGEPSNEGRPSQHPSKEIGQ